MAAIAHLAAAADAAAPPVSADRTVPFNWGLIGVAKDFGIVVSLIWFMYFVMTSTLPGLQREFQELVARERETFVQELRTQRQHDEKRYLDLAQAIRESSRDLIGEIRRGRNGHFGPDQ